MGMMDFLMSERQQRILAALFLHPERSYSVSELLRIGGGGHGATQNVLSQLQDAGVVSDERLGNQRRFRVNPRWPLYNELRAICVKSFGVRERIGEALAPLSGKIRFAFVFGSVAKGTDRADSDIDLFVVGDLDLFELNAALGRVEGELGRPIHANLFGTEDWGAAANDLVVSDIFNGPKIMVIGDVPSANV